MTVIRDVIQPVINDVIGSVMGSAALSYRAAAIADFNGGTIEGGLWDVTDPTQNTVGRDGTGGDVSNGGVVGRHLDLSGHDGHMSAENDAARSDWVIANDIGAAVHDGNLDRYFMGATPSFASAGLVRVFVAVETTDTQGAIFVGSPSTRYFGFYNSATSANSWANVGSPINYVNGSALADDNADTLNTALAAGPCVLEISNLDLSLWTDFKFNGLGGGNQFAGRFLRCSVFPENDLTPAIRTRQFNFCGEAAGVAPAFFLTLTDDGGSSPLKADGSSFPLKADGTSFPQKA